MSKSEKIQISVSLAFVALLTIGFIFGTSRSGNRLKATQDPERVKEKVESITSEPFQLDQIGYPTWNVMNKRSVFQFKDKQNLVIPMKQAGVKEILLMRTMAIHSLNFKDTHIGEWIIPAHDDYKDTTFVHINVESDNRYDTVEYTIETLVFPIEAFKRGANEYE